MIPENEQGVIVLFAQQAASAGFEIVSIGTAFPDALVVKDGVEYRAEFEYQAASFKGHKHDVRKCDIIIAWVNDWPDCVLPVLALSEPSWPDTDLALPGEVERKAAYWEMRAKSAEAQLRLAGEGKTEEAKAEIRIRNKTRKRLLSLYTDNPKLGATEAGNTLGISRQMVYKYLNSFEADGLVERNGQGVKVL